MMNAVDVIQIRNVSQKFQSGDSMLPIVSDVSFTIKESSFNIIFGQSGSGKSTLLNILSGLQSPTTGKVLFHGMPLYEMTNDQLANFRAEKIGIVYQTNYWVKSLTVLENVAMPLYFLGYSRLRAAPLARQALDKVGMLAYEHRQPFFLSGGEQQRVAIARGIVNNPAVLIADEPTGNLDTKNGDKIIAMMQDYTAGSGTLIMVTHNMEYLPLADHLLHIQDGKVNDLKGSNYHQMTASLLQDMKQRIDVLAQKNASKK